MSNLYLKNNNTCLNAKIIPLKGRELIKYKKTLRLNKLQREVLIGTLLGDSTIPKQKSNNYNVKFEQSIKNKEYIDHLYLIFKDWVGTGPKIRNIKGGGANDRQSVWFRTYKHEFFKYYYDIFYDGGKKKVPKNIKNLMTPRVIAYWFMDDGTKTISGYILNTQGFILEDQEFLVDVLKDLGLVCNLWRDKNSFKIYIMAESKWVFTDLVSSYVLECFYYKLHKR